MPSPPGADLLTNPVPVDSLVLSSEETAASVCAPHSVFRSHLSSSLQLFYIPGR